MTKLFVSLGVILFSTLVLASNQQPPRGVLVQMDAAGNAKVYKSDAAGSVTSQEQAQAAIKEAATEANLIQPQTVSSLDELDQTSSQESWYCYRPHPGYYPGYNPNYPAYSYNYNYYGYTYYYRSYYIPYVWGGYTWYWYRWW